MHTAILGEVSSAECTTRIVNTYFLDILYSISHSCTRENRYPNKNNLFFLFLRTMDVIMAFHCFCLNGFEHKSKIAKMQLYFCIHITVQIQKRLNAQSA